MKTKKILLNPLTIHPHTKAYRNAPSSLRPPTTLVAALLVVGRPFSPPVPACVVTAVKGFVTAPDTDEEEVAVLDSEAARSCAI